MKMQKVFNLATDEEQHFGGCSDLWCVCFAYAAENNLTSAILSAAQNGNLEEFYKTLPVTQGKRSIACGDWALFQG